MTLFVRQRRAKVTFLVIQCGTANLLERTFGENRRRTKVIPHFFTEKAALKLSYAVLLAVSNKWRGLRMDAFTSRQVEELRGKVLVEPAVEESVA